MSGSHVSLVPVASACLFIAHMDTRYPLLSTVLYCSYPTIRPPPSPQSSPFRGPEIYMHLLCTTLGPLDEMDCPQPSLPWSTLHYHANTSCSRTRQILRLRRGESVLKLPEEWAQSLQLSESPKFILANTPTHGLTLGIWPHFSGSQKHLIK